MRGVVVHVSPGIDPRTALCIYLRVFAGHSLHSALLSSFSKFQRSGVSRTETIKQVDYESKFSLSDCIINLCYWPTGRSVQ